MKLINRERVPSTDVVIGRKVQYRKVGGERVEKISTTWTAEYREHGVRRFEGLGTTRAREARQLARQIQARLEAGEPSAPRSRSISVKELTEKYLGVCEAKDLAPKTMAKYRVEMARLAEFCESMGIERAESFDEPAFYSYGQWLRSQLHKQGRNFAPKTLYTSLTCVKQCFRWGQRVKLLRSYALDNAKLPHAKPRPQPCPSDEQVRAILGATHGEEQAAFALMAYAGLRLGEVLALRWADVRLDMGNLGMLHIRRGGSRDHTKDKEDRFVPIHERLRPVLDALPRSHDAVLPALRGRTLLARLKRINQSLGYGTNIKLHSFRHYFASSCANSAVPYRLSLEWLGHTSSDILDLYYHLSDAESAAAMRLLSERAEAQR